MKVNRRKFIHLGAWSGAALALPDPFKRARNQRRPFNVQSARVMRKDRNPCPTTCSLCGNHCGLMSYREGDRVVMLLGNREHPVASGKVCAKTYAQLDRLYDFDRILKPRRRVGERGEGKWKEISWDEALAVVKEKLTPLQENGGADLCFIDGREELLTGAFFTLFPQATRVAADDGDICKRFHREYYGDKVILRDFAACRYLLNFAADPFRSGESYLTEVQSLIQGLNENGLELVTIAGRLSQTGGKSRDWHPVHPRHYGDVAKAIAGVMLARGWYDRKTLSSAGLTAEALAAYLKPFTPAAVSRQAGLPEKVILRLARKLGTRSPAMVILGEEVFQTDNGWENACAIELLNLLSGALQSGGPMQLAPRLPLAAEIAAAEPEVSAGWFWQNLKDSRRSKVLVSYQANPLFDSYAEWFPAQLLKKEHKVEFFLALDTYINETNQYADLILPMATELECWGLFNHRLNEQECCLSLRQPVSRPTDEILLLRQARVKTLQLFEPARMAPVAAGREFNQFVLELGRMLGRKEAPFSFADVESYVGMLVEQIPEVAAGGGLAKLKKQGFIVYRAPAALDNKVSLSLPDLGSPRPLTREKYSENELFLIPFAWQVLDSQTANSKYLAELRHSNPLWLHPQRAAKLGLAEGDRVRIETVEGEIKVKVWITQAIHPDCAAIAQGHGHSKIGRVAQAQTIAKYDPMTKALLSRKNFFFTPFTFRLNCWDKKEPIWWHQEGNGQHFNFLFSGKPDKHVSGLTIINPLIKIAKA